GPHPHAIALRHQLAADAGVVVLRLAREFLLQRLRPLGLFAERGGLVGHGHRHGIPPVMVWAIYSGSYPEGEGGSPSGMRGRGVEGDENGRGGGPMRGRALVIGGSMSGLLAGLMLRERGWDVDVFERVESELSGRGAGIVAQTELIAILKSLRLDTRDLGVEVTTRQILDASGRVA